MTRPGAQRPGPREVPLLQAAVAGNAAMATELAEVVVLPLGESASARPTVQRLVLSSQLRRLRESRGITTEQAAEAIRGSHSKISRMEHGRVSFKERDVGDLLTLYGVTDSEERAALLNLAREANTPGWWHAYSDILPAWLEPYAGLEAAASVIRTYQIQHVPGLLQTEKYGRAMGDRRQGPGAEPGQAGDRGIALDGLEPRAVRAAHGEQQGAVGEVLQDRWLDGVFVDPLGGRGVAPAGAVRPAVRPGVRQPGGADEAARACLLDREVGDRVALVAAGHGLPETQYCGTTADGCAGKRRRRHVVDVVGEQSQDRLEVAPVECSLGAVEGAGQPRRRTGPGSRSMRPAAWAASPGQLTSSVSITGRRITPALRGWPLRSALSPRCQRTKTKANSEQATATAAATRNAER